MNWPWSRKKEKMNGLKNTSDSDKQHVLDETKDLRERLSRSQMALQQIRNVEQIVRENRND